MLSKKRTMSDKIIALVRKRGYRNRIPDNAAAEIALKLAEGMHKDIRRTRRLVLHLGE